MTLLDPPTPTDARRRLGRAGGALADQVLSSGTGLLLVVLVARAGDAATFGALSLALVVNGFLLGVVRAAIGEVVLLRCRRDVAHAPVEARLGLFLALLAGGVAGLGLLGTGAVLGGDVGRFLQLVAVAAPFVYAQDLLRYLAYGTGRVDGAIAVDAVWFGVQAVASAGLVLTDRATPTRLLLAWLAGAVASAAVGCLTRRLRPRVGALGPWWREERGRAAGFVSDFLVSTGMVQASFILLGVLLPLDEFGALRVAFVSLSPLANLLAGVRTLTLAHLAGLRGSPTRARRRASQVALALVACGGVYGVGLVLLPDRWGAELFGSTWMDAQAFVGVVAIGEVFRLSTFPAIDLMKVFATPMVLVRTRAVAAVGVVTGLLAGAAVAGPRGAATCVAIAYALATAIWWRQALLVEHGAAQQVPTVRS